MCCNFNKIVRNECVAQIDDQDIPQTSHILYLESIIHGKIKDDIIQSRSWMVKMIKWFQNFTKEKSY